MHALLCFSPSSIEFHCKQKCSKLKRPLSSYVVIDKLAKDLELWRAEDGISTFHSPSFPLSPDALLPLLEADTPQSHILLAFWICWVLATAHGTLSLPHLSLAVL